MTLDEFLKTHRLSEEAFAGRIGVSQQAVHRYRKGRVPQHKVLAKIIAATDGQVTANDFFTNREAA